MKSSAASCEVRRANPFARESLRLIGELWSELGTLYPEINAPLFPPNDVSGDRAVFVLAWLGDKAVGCGAFRPLPADDPSIAEIKRMYVEPAVRRRGVSKAILAKLEELASGCGYLTARLETGMRQPGAIHLYETAGYQRIKPYGRYANDPLSVCFEKSLVVAAVSNG